MLALSRADLRTFVSMTDAIALMKTAFAELSAGRAEAPLRTGIHLGETHLDALFMPASVPGLDALGVKIVGVAHDNPSRGLPLIHAVVFLLDPSTGEPLAILDGTYLTALRTGAVSGAATDLLARPDASVLAVFGAGAQGITQAAAVCAVRPVERIVIIDLDEDRLHRYRDALAIDWPDLIDRLEMTTDASVVREADIVCTATTSRSPVFDDANIRPGTHINGVGAYTPEMQEIPAETVARAIVIVDQVEAALAEGGDLTIPLASGLIDRDHIRAELGDLVAGTKSGRTDDGQVTFFKSVGNAIQDVVVAQRAVTKARAAGAGVEVRLD